MEDNVFSFFSEYYDSIQDPVCIFDNEGFVAYCNEAFSALTGTSQIRFLNKKTTVFNSFISIDEKPFDLARTEEFCGFTGVSILKFETKKVLRGLGQFAIRKLSLPPHENLYQISLKDLTVEEDLVKTFRFELASRNKKIDEMNQLVEIFQKIRLLDEPSLIVNEFMNYQLSFSQFFAAAKHVNKEMSIIHGEESSKDAGFIEVMKEIDAHLTAHLVSKYQTQKSAVKNGDSSYYWSVVPFKLANETMHAIFIFDSMDQMNKFSHQSAIILSEQLNLILNNLTLKELSFTDGLTKLKNNLYFRKKIEEVCSSSQTAQLILFDVDFFKKVNDTYGHPGGDAVLMFLGEKIPAVMQKVNPDFAAATIARVGGEEFAIIIPDKEQDFAQMFAEAFRAEIEASTVMFNDIAIKFTVSLGVSSWTPKHAFSPEAVKLLYKAADDALYNSKRSGRNRVSVLAA